MKSIRVVWKQLTIVLLGTLGVLAIGALGIATLRDNVLEERRALAKHTVELGFRLLADYRHREMAGELPHADAQERARERMRSLGLATPEYYWIVTPDYRVVMHPHFPQYEGDLFTEMDNPRLAEALTNIVDIARRDHDGFISYLWTRPNSQELVPKFSYVMTFEPWGWILGSGVYVDDVQQSIDTLAWGVGGVGLLILALVLVGSILLSRSITTPLTQVAAGLRRLSAGELDVEIPHEDRGDELGDLIQAMRVFQQSLVDREQLLRELERRNEVLQESEARFRDLAELLPETVVEIDLEGTLTYANRAAYRVFGLPGNAVAKGLPLLEMFAEGEHGRLRQMVRSITGGETSGAVQFQARRMNGERFTVLFRSVPVMRGRDVVGLRSVMFDISEHIAADRREAELRDEIAHVGRLSTMGEMAAGFAHELNQPLAAINNYARGSLRRIDAGMTDIGMLRMPLEHIREEAMRAGEIIRRIRDFVRKRKAERVIFRIEDVIKDVGGLLGSEIRHGQIDFDVAIEPGLPPVLGDPVSIRQVLLNLIRNAIEVLDMGASRDRRITVTAARTGTGAVAISVSDTGPGIREDIRRKVFEPFFTTKVTGTGMGLSICRTIVEAHGGVLDLDTPEDGGSRFRFNLPVDADSERSVA